MFSSIFNSSSNNPLRNYSQKIAEFASKSALVIRKGSKFKPDVFITALISSANSGYASFRSIAQTMSEIDPECNLSAPALWKRISKPAQEPDAFSPLENFLLLCFTFFNSISFLDNKSKIKSSPFKRILTEDSSFVKMLKQCAKMFPAHGNKYGATAGIKLDLIFDLLTGTPVFMKRYKGTEQDKTIAPIILDFVQNGDLVLRDMGYFVIHIFDQIEEKGADWLSRLPANITATNSDGKDLDTILRRTKSSLIDCKMVLTEGKKEVRLIAVKKSEKEENKAIVKLKKDATAKGKTPSQKAITRAKWHILVTSVDAQVLNAEELGKIYAQRWQIEIIFKAWKQSGNQSKTLNRKSNKQHMVGLFLSEVLRLCLSMLIWSNLRQQNYKGIERLSITGNSHTGKIT